MSNIRLLRIGFVAMLFSMIISLEVVGEENCGCNSSCNSNCKPCCVRKRHHCCRCDQPPLAPVMGSAPAMMAPVLFTQVGATAYPSAQVPMQRPAIDQAALRELLSALSDLKPSEAPTCQKSNAPVESPKSPAQSPAKSPAQSPAQAPSDNSVSQRLSQMDERLLELEKTLSKIDTQAAELITKLDGRIRALEGKSKGEYNVAQSKGE